MSSYFTKPHADKLREIVGQLDKLVRDISRDYEDAVDEGIGFAFALTTGELDAALRILEQISADEDKLHGKE